MNGGPSQSMRVLASAERDLRLHKLARRDPFSALLDRRQRELAVEKAELAAIRKQFERMGEELESIEAGIRTLIEGTEQ